MTARPLYARMLRLRNLTPGGVLCFVYVEGAAGLGILLALAELVSWWGVLVLPASIAVMVKLNDVLAGAAARSRLPARGAAGAAVRRSLAARSQARAAAGQHTAAPASVPTQATAEGRTFTSAPVPDSVAPATGVPVAHAASTPADTAVSMPSGREASMPSGREASVLSGREAEMPMRGGAGVLAGHDMTVGAEIDAGAGHGRIYGTASAAASSPDDAEVYGAAVARGAADLRDAADVHGLTAVPGQGARRGLAPAQPDVAQVARFDAAQVAGSGAARFDAAQVTGHGTAWETRSEAAQGGQRGPAQVGRPGVAQGRPAAVRGAGAPRFAGQKVPAEPVEQAMPLSGSTGPGRSGTVYGSASTRGPAGGADDRILDGSVETPGGSVGAGAGAGAEAGAGAAAAGLPAGSHGRGRRPAQNEGLAGAGSQSGNSWQHHPIRQNSARRAADTGSQRQLDESSHRSRPGFEEDRRPGGPTGRQSPPGTGAGRRFADAAGRHDGDVRVDQRSDLGRHSDTPQQRARQSATHRYE